MISKTFLSKYASSDVIADPFPYLILENPFHDSEYKELYKSYPEDNCISNIKPKKNHRYQISANSIINSESISSSWKEALDNHCSEPLIKDFIRIFEPFIWENYDKQVANNIINYSTWSYRGSSAETDLTLDFQPGINTPPGKLRRTSVRGPHLDNPREIFAALIYFRDPCDNSIGGDLEICELIKDFRLYGKSETPISTVNVVNRVNYGRNTGLIFLNTHKSVHSVTKRSFSEHNRKLLNIIMEYKEPVFSIERSNNLQDKFFRIYKRFF